MASAVEFSVASRIVRCGASEVRLTEQQSAAFTVIARHVGGIAPHSEITSAAKIDSESYYRVAILRMRARLHAAGIPLQIKLVHGAGYAFDLPVTVVEDDGSITLGRDAVRIVRRLIEACPSPLLAEQARRAIFG